MRVVVSTDSERDQNRIVRLLQDGATLVPVGAERNHSFHNLQDVDCIVCVYRAESLPARLLVLEEFERTLPTVPLVLVTDPTDETAKLVCSLRLSDIVWFDNVESELPLALASAVIRGRFRVMLERVEVAGLPPLITKAIVLALASAEHETVRKPRELAEALGCSPVTLSQEFHRAVGGAFTLGEFLAAIQVLRVRQLRGARTPWEATERIVRFSTRSLRRKSRSWPGCTLKELQAMDARILLRRFERERFEPLIERSS